MLYTQISHADLSLEVSDDIVTNVGMREGTVTCASIAVHVQFVCQAHRYFTCNLTIYTLQALYQNHIISCLHTSSILHDIPKLFLFQQVCDIIHAVEILVTVPLLKTNF
jgi:hypothetical protein